MLVIGGEGFGPTPQKNCRKPQAPGRKSNKLKRAEELNAQAAPAHAIQILTEEDFCRLAGVPSAEPKRQYHAMRDLLARYRALREDHLRYLVKCGILRPVHRTNADTFFAFPDLRDHQAGERRARPGRLVPQHRAHADRRRVRGSSSSISGWTPRPQRSSALRRPAGPQRPPPSPQKPRTARHDSALAEEYFRAAPRSTTATSDQEEAAAAYRKALELDPYLVAALINLANIHYSRDELVEAQALYERAIGLERSSSRRISTSATSTTTSGGSRRRRTVTGKRSAQPLLCRRALLSGGDAREDGAVAEARPHWRAYQQLAPQGEWVELAKEFSD